MTSMQRRSYGRDLGLTVRMSVSLGLLVLLCLPFLTGVLLCVYLWTGAWELTGVALIVLGGAASFLPAVSERTTLALAGAQVVQPSERPDLHALVERLCALAELPKPRIAVIASDVPNAFAAGRSPANGVVAVTEGLVRRLEPEELEAVVAHELAHIANRDALVMTLVSFPAAAGHAFFRRTARLVTEGSIRRRLLAGFFVLYLSGLLFTGWLAYAFAALLVMTISRYREFAGDRGAVLITGAPEQLQSALQKIAAAMPLIPRRDLRALAGLNAFFVVPARSEGGGFALDPLAFFPTHPPLERRLERLSDLAQVVGRSVAAEPAHLPRRGAGERPANEPAVRSLVSAGCYWLLTLGAVLFLQEGSPGSVLPLGALALLAFGYGVVSALKGIGRAQAGASGMPYAVLSLTLLLGPYALALLAAIVVGALTLLDLGPLR